MAFLIRENTCNQELNCVVHLRAKQHTGTSQELNCGKVKVALLHLYKKYRLDTVVHVFLLVLGEDKIKYGLIPRGTFL